MAPVIRVVTRRLDGLGEADLDAERALLSAAERHRATRFVFETGRVEYITAHALVRASLAEALDVTPDRLSFVDGAYGKPAAWVDGGPAPISFNLSHTRGMVAVAIGSAELDLGIDVEDGARRIELSIADSYFAPPEVAWMLARPEADQRAAFLTLWTLKEAYIKAIGLGMSQELDRFWFADPDREPVRVAFAADLDDDPAVWRFERRMLGDGTAAGHHHIALAWRGAGELDWSGVA